MRVRATNALPLRFCHLCWIFLHLLPYASEAQEIALVVVDSAAGVPIGGVGIELIREKGVATTSTNSLGRVVVDMTGLQRVIFRRFGYEERVLSAEQIVAISGTVRLAPRPAQLRALAAIAANPYQILNPAVENMYLRRRGRPHVGAKILVVGDREFDNTGTVDQLRKRYLRRTRGIGCRGPLWFLNGFEVKPPFTEDLGQISLRMLEGVEIFSEPTYIPAEYWRLGSHCGVVALWTRVS